MTPVPVWAAKRDAVEPEIVGEYQRAGWSVQPLNGKGIPDLLVAPPGERPDLVECKTNDAKLTPDQVEWHKAWGGAKPLIVRTGAQARKHIRMRAEERRREVAAAVEANGPVTWTEAVEQSEDARLASLRVGKDLDKGPG